MSDLPDMTAEVDGTKDAASEGVAEVQPSTPKLSPEQTLAAKIQAFFEKCADDKVGPEFMKKYGINKARDLTIQNFSATLNPDDQNPRVVISQGSINCAIVDCKSKSVRYYAFISPDVNNFVVSVLKSTLPDFSNSGDVYIHPGQT